MGLEISEEDRFRPITPIRVAIPIPQALKKTKKEEEEGAVAEELLHLEHEEECHTPKSPAAHVTLKQLPSVCPPAPKKPRQAARRSLRRLWPSKSKYFFKVPDDLESLFMVITGTNTPAKNLSVWKT
ncbi:cyclin-dependent protein kinase inhibitor SMR10 [Pyrus x bretschneideri]|uniref:cyclin-dependent protein kinase inhibitor SMR10 n=1 Tax=Pyrus x bretschneideri TaxID=225117 RepID=UPI00202FE546|nr:cyclin-dependent protein kinase inhibitor SMR10 [Pyrus x bretschneideri]